MRIFLAKAYSAKGIQEGASAHYRAALKIDSKNEKTFKRLLKLHEEQKDFDSLITYLTETTKCEPKNAFYHHYLAQAYEQKKLNTEAFFACKKSVELAPGNHTFYRDLMELCFFHSENSDAAFENFLDVASMQADLSNEDKVQMRIEWNRHLENTDYRSRMAQCVLALTILGKTMKNRGVLKKYFAFLNAEQEINQRSTLKGLKGARGSGEVVPYLMHFIKQNTTSRSLQKLLGFFNEPSEYQKKITSLEYVQNTNEEKDAIAFEASKKEAEFLANM